MLGAAFEHRNMQDQVLLRAKMTKLCRQEMFSTNIPSFAGTFSKDCQNEGTSQCLKLLAYMLLRGSGMDTEECCTQEVLTIVQLITFNSKKARRNITVEDRMTSDQGRHTLSSEPPLPLYVGLTIHSASRSKVLIENKLALWVFAALTLK